MWAALAACGLFTGHAARAAEEERAFGASTLQEALSALSALDAPDAPDSVPGDATQIVLTAPDLAEDGAFVPVTVESRLPGTQEIFIVVEANPNPMVVRFTIPPGTDAWVSTRIKMAESSTVHAIVRADGRLCSASRQTRVVVGGCG